MTTMLDLGGGQSVPRHHLPKNMTSAFDQASAAFDQARASIRSWVKPLYALQAPADVSGRFSCNAVGQSGRIYDLSEPGGAMLVDERDVPIFTKQGFAAVPSQQPATNLRAGLVFQDTAANTFMRWTGTAWSPVTLT